MQNCNFAAIPNAMRELLIVCSVLTLTIRPPWLVAQSQPQNSPAQQDDLSKVQNLIERGQFESAESLVRQALQSGRDPFSAYLALGYLDLSRQRVYASTRAYREAQKLQPHYAEANRLLAVNYFLLNQKLLFKQEIQEAIQDNPRDEQSYYLAGRFAYEVDKRFDLAANYFSQAVALDEHDYKAHYYLGLSDKELNRPADAQREFERACALVTSLKVKYDLPFRSLAELFSEHLDQEQAWQYAEKAIAVDPRGTENYYLRGKAELAMDRVANAMQSLQEAASLDPTYAQPYYLLGRIYNRMGQNDRAAQAFARFQILQKEYDGK
jgi:tetratricopeptide (TPR) repeat protein